jgi:hypothetical protein
MQVMLKGPVFIGVSETGGKDSLPPSQFFEIRPRPRRGQHFQALPADNSDVCRENFNLPAQFSVLNVFPEQMRQFSSQAERSAISERHFPAQVDIRGTHAAIPPSWTSRPGHRILLISLSVVETDLARVVHEHAGTKTSRGSDGRTPAAIFILS